MQAEARDSGVYLSQTQLRGNVSLPLVPRGALMSVTTARDETESVWLSLSLSDSPGIAAPAQASRWLLSS